MMDEAIELDEPLDELLGEMNLAVPEHAVGAAKKFEAWHHPRKQFVRIQQWCTEVKNLIPQLGLAQGHPFRYLTLPGNELLDVRALHGVCENSNVSLRYLGFNSVGKDTPSQIELAISQDEVRAMASIDKFSRVIEDKLESVGNVRSQAAADVLKEGPFHAINLDLCDAITLREVGHNKGSALGALGRLLDLQLSSQKPWLLFITTKAEPGLVAEIARNGFDSAIAANVAASELFRGKLANLISADLHELDGKIEEAWKLEDETFLKVFCMGLGKWLLGLMANSAPPRELTLLSGYYYRSGSKPNMLSLAFRCEPGLQTINDPHAILPAPPAMQLLSEVDCALNMTDKLLAMLDLDHHVLFSDAEVQKKLIAQAGRLLATARYSETDYEEWAKARIAEMADILQPQV